MDRQIEAVYLDGKFLPVHTDEVHVSEGETVWLTVLNAEERAQYILDLAQQVYEGLSEEEIAEIESAIRRRPLFENDAEFTDESRLSNKPSTDRVRA